MESIQITDYALVAQWGVVLGASLAAALWDLRSRRIPNLLTLPLFVSGLAWQGWTGGFSGILDGLLACLMMALPFVILFLYAGGGAGDAKMMGALGIWLGVSSGAVALVAVVCSGAVLGLLFAKADKRLAVVFRHMKQIVLCWIGQLLTLGWRGSKPPKLIHAAGLTEMPYALSILCGVCVAAVGVLA